MIFQRHRHNSIQIEPNINLPPEDFKVKTYNGNTRNGCFYSGAMLKPSMELALVPEAGLSGWTTLTVVGPRTRLLSVVIRCGAPTIVTTRRTSESVAEVRNKLLLLLITRHCGVM